MSTYKDPSFELQNIPLTQEEAEIRHSQIKDVSYELQIAMPQDKDFYRGNVKVNFHVGANTDNLFLDFHGR